MLQSERKIRFQWIVLDDVLEFTGFAVVVVDGPKENGDVVAVVVAVDGPNENG